MFRLFTHLIPEKAGLTRPALAVLATVLAGCSTVKDLSPFGSTVPYAQDIQPTIPKPAISELPVYKRSPTPPAPAAPPLPAAAPPPPAASPPRAAPTPPPPPAPAPAEAPAPPTRQIPPPPAPSDSLPLPEAPPPRRQSAAAPAAPIPAVASQPPVSQPATGPASPSPAPAGPASPIQASANQASANQAGADADVSPSIPEDRRRFKDDGNYPNLAQVPSRPVGMPTFAEAAMVEKDLKADRANAAKPSPPSPAAPSPDSAPASSAAPLAAPPAAIPPATGETVARAEDRSPCLTEVAGTPAATIRFDQGSSALTADAREKLAEAVPALRGAKGTVRVFGHGDTGPDAAPAAKRFDLAAGRAGAVAQAVAGFGIPAGRIATGVACVDSAAAGASVQLYSEP